MIRIIFISLFLLSCAQNNTTSINPILLELNDGKIFYNGKKQDLKCPSQDYQRFFKFNKHNVYFDLFCAKDSDLQIFLPVQFIDIETQNLELYNTFLHDKSTTVFRNKKDLYLLVRNYAYSENFIGQKVCIKDYRYFKWDFKQKVFKPFKARFNFEIPSSLINDKDKACLSQA